MYTSGRTCPTHDLKRHKGTLEQYSCAAAQRMVAAHATPYSLAAASPTCCTRNISHVILLHGPESADCRVSARARCISPPGRFCWRRALSWDVVSRWALRLEAGPRPENSVSCTAPTRRTTVAPTVSCVLYCERTLSLTGTKNVCSGHHAPPPAQSPNVTGCGAALHKCCLRVSSPACTTAG